VDRIVRTYRYTRRADLHQTLHALVATDNGGQPTRDLLLCVHCTCLPSVPLHQCAHSIRRLVRSHTEFGQCDVLWHASPGALDPLRQKHTTHAARAAARTRHLIDTLSLLTSHHSKVLLVGFQDHRRGCKQAACTQQETLSVYTPGELKNRLQSMMLKSPELLLACLGDTEITVV